MVRGLDAENNYNETNFKFAQVKANQAETIVVDGLQDGYFYAIYVTAKNSHPKYPRETPDALI